LGIVNPGGSFVPPPGNYLVQGKVACTNTNDTLTVLKVDLQKNAASLYTTAQESWRWNTVSTIRTIEGTVGMVVSANGTDAFTVVATASYTGGTGTFLGTLTWLAV